MRVIAPGIAALDAERVAVPLPRLSAKSLTNGFLKGGGNVLADGTAVRGRVDVAVDDRKLRRFGCGTGDFGFSCGH
jgi:hypothetical protein